MKSCGLTLLEVLAAAVLLGLLAAAVTPLLQRVGAGRLRSVERIEAAVALVRAFDRVPQPFASGNAGSVTIAGHAGWTLHWEPLERAAPAATGSLQVPRAWWRVTVLDGAGAVLAERVFPRPQAAP